MNGKYILKGGFGFSQIIASDNIVEWHRKETEKNQMEKDPVLRAYNTIKVNVNPNILPSNPFLETDMQEIENFPFSQINDLAPPGGHTKQLMEIESKLANQDKTILEGEMTSKEKELLSQLFGMNSSQALDFVKYLKGEIKAI